MIGLVGVDHHGFYYEVVEDYDGCWWYLGDSGSFDE